MCRVVKATLTLVVWRISKWAELVAVAKLKSLAMTTRVVSCVPLCGLVMFANSSGWSLQHSDFQKPVPV